MPVLLRSLVCAFAASLGFCAVGETYFDVGGLWFGDLLLAAAVVPLLLAGAVRWRQLVRQPLLRATGLLCAAQLLAALPRDGGQLELKHLAGPLQLWAAVACVALVALDGQGRTVRVWAARGGLAALAISLAGAALALLLGWHEAFLRIAPHPLWGPLPRLTGAFGLSPQRCGEWLGVLAALVACDYSLTVRLRRGALWCCAGALIATFSWAWIVGATVALGALRRASGVLRGAAALALLLACLAGSWALDVGVGTPRAPAAPCDELDREHFVVIEEGGRCAPAAGGLDGSRPLTLQLFAKQVAWAAFRRHPLLGVGTGAYNRFGASIARERFGSDAFPYYDAPHSTPLGALATGGLVGGLALLVWLVAVLRARPAPGSAERWLWLALVGLCLDGLNADVLRLRELWLLLGLLAGSASESVSDSASASASASESGLGLGN
jgi:hypothetical protein